MSESAILVRNVEVSAADPVQPMASGEEAPIDLPEFDVPPMRIVVLLVGTQGDVMPFIDIAHRLKVWRYGHVVRIASHGDLRAPVEKAGLRFYPLEGNARQMAGWGPSFSLQPVTLMKLAANPATTTKLMVLRRVIQSTIRACTEPDPADADAEPFHADVIMSNPMSLGHIHCAEALGVPLHLFFPNPWVATTEYPHSFSGWRYPSTPSSTSPTGYEWTRHKSSFFSYRIVDSVLWHTFLPYVNELRASCRLRTLRVGSLEARSSRTSACPSRRCGRPRSRRARTTGPTTSPSPASSSGTRRRRTSTRPRPSSRRSSLGSRRARSPSTSASVRWSSRG